MPEVLKTEKSENWKERRSRFRASQAQDEIISKRKLPTLLGNFKSLGVKAKGQGDILFRPKLANKVAPTGLPMGFSTPK